MVDSREFFRLLAKEASEMYFKFKGNSRTKFFGNNTIAVQVRVALQMHALTLQMHYLLC